MSVVCTNSDDCAVLELSNLRPTPVRLGRRADPSLTVVHLRERVPV